MSTPFVVKPLNNMIEIRLTKECANDCSHQGECDEDVAFWVNKLRKKLEKIPAELVASVLKSYGAWDAEELKDSEQNLHRLLWLAAGSVKDEKSCWVYMEGY